jgi:hypothetical protein
MKDQSRKDCDLLLLCVAENSSFRRDAYRVANFCLTKLRVSGETVASLRISTTQRRPIIVGVRSGVQRVQNTWTLETIAQANSVWTL